MLVRAVWVDFSHLIISIAAIQSVTIIRIDTSEKLGSRVLDKI